MSLTIPSSKQSKTKLNSLKLQNVWKIECGNRSTKVATVLCIIDYNDNDDDGAAGGTSGGLHPSKGYKTCGKLRNQTF